MIVLPKQAEDDMKKIISFIICLCVMLTLCSVSAFSQTAATAQDLTKTNTVNISNNSNGKLLSDEKRTTKLTIKAGTKITISNTQQFSSIYVIWDKPPGEWTLTINGVDQTYGKYDFIHEYIDLPNLTNEVTITIKSDSVILCDVYTFTSNQTPDWVQKWAPSYENADMLLMPTHADDELIFFGGAIPYYAGEKGLKVQVAYMTNHWGEPYRPHEALNALWACGLTAYPVMGAFPDIYSTSLVHAKKVYNYDKIINYNIELIRRFKPEVIIAHDLKGEYGHGGHMINANALTEALTKSNDRSISPESAQKYGVWDVPKTYLHLYGENKVKMNWDIPLSKFNGKTAYEMAVIGFSYHSSQQQWYSVKKTPGVYDCQAFGLYRTTVGPDIAKNDFMENIKLEEEKKPEDSSVIDSSPDSQSSSTTDEKKQSTTEKNEDYKAYVYIAGSVVVVGIVLIIFMQGKKKNKK